jgi:hypothetical protein
MAGAVADPVRRLGVGVQLGGPGPGDFMKRIYRRHQLRMIKEVVAQSDWTLAQIEEREQRLLEWARSEWDDLPDE